MTDRAPWLYPTAAYVHVPFCAHHCGYCDFAVAVGQDERIDAYLDTLETELSWLGEPHPVQTLFFGGGTPTYLPHRPLDLLRLVRHWLPLQAEHEFSVEANPSYLDVAKIDLLAAFGVNRLSLGVQSFQLNLLRTLSAIIGPRMCRACWSSFGRALPMLSVDLIFGAPGQSDAQWRDNLAGVALAPNHLATYGLTYEKGTRLWKQRERGEVIA